MAKIISTDFGSIHDALNKMIVAEVKAALELLPEKCMTTNDWHVPLCRIVVSTAFDYNPIDLGVRRVWLDKDGDLCFSEYTANQDEDGIYDMTENDDLLDITDFQYLIDQIAEKVEGEHDLRPKEPGKLFYSERKIYDKVRWIGPDGVEVETVISGILAEQEPDEPTEIIYTTNLLLGNKLHTAYLTENAILKD